VEEIFTKVPNRYPKKDENVFSLFIRYFELPKKWRLGLMKTKKAEPCLTPPFLFHD
jgi:hypothetical protein